jgi:hypothetical protein
VIDPETSVCRLSKRPWNGIVAQKGDKFFPGLSEFTLEQIMDEGTTDPNTCVLDGSDRSAADKLFQTWGVYKLTENNCQHFVTELLGNICQETNYGKTRESKALYHNQGSVASTISPATLAVVDGLQASSRWVSSKRK